MLICLRRKIVFTVTQLYGPSASMRLLLLLFLFLFVIDHNRQNHTLMSIDQTIGETKQSQRATE